MTIGKLILIIIVIGVAIIGAVPLIAMFAWPMYGWWGMGGMMGGGPMGGMGPMGGGMGGMGPMGGAPMGGGQPYGSQPYGPMGGPMMGGCPAWWGSYMNVNDTNVAEYVNNYVAALGPNLEVKTIEKYSNNYYVLVWDASRNMGAFELLVFYNGFIHPEPHSMMWNTLYGPHASGALNYPIGLEEARGIAERWVSSRFPNATIVEEYAFPGYYTFHFRYGDQMQMLSVNAFTGQVVFHEWHGTYIGNVLEHEE